MFRSTITSLVALTLLGAASAQTSDLAVTEPSAAHWWVAQSANTLAWSGTTPAQFSVFLNNPDTSLLTSKYAIISIQQVYEYSKTIDPGSVTPGTGYVFELTDTLNSSNIYATSEPFEIKAKGSPYPPQTTPSSTGSVVTASGSAPVGSASGASSAPSASSSGAAWPAMTAGAGAIGAAVMGCLTFLL